MKTSDPKPDDGQREFAEKLYWVVERRDNTLGGMYSVRVKNPYDGLWRWHALASKRRDVAVRQAPAAVAAVLEMFAEEAEERIAKLSAHVISLRKAAADLRASEEGR